MSTPAESLFAVDPPDAELVLQALEGRTDAFGRLVERHQGLVCSLALGFSGDLHRSEDIAQEAFVSAWRKLGELRDPALFKPWLCGITRNVAKSTLRKDARTPLAAPGADEREREEREGCASPAEEAIAREERDLVLRQLLALPPQYREPMVLFYRQNESVASVAEVLGISEDAVKQRLARGRAMLAERIERGLGCALKASAPAASITVAVIGVIGAGKARAFAASTTGAVTKASSGASGGGMASPFLALAGISAGLCSVMRAQTDKSVSLDERRFAGRTYFWMTTVCVIFGGLIGVTAAMKPSWALLLCIGWPVLLAPAGWRFGVWMCRRREVIRLGHGAHQSASKEVWRLGPEMPEFRKTILGLISATGCYPLFFLGLVGEVPRWISGTFVAGCVGISLLSVGLVLIRPASHRGVVLGHLGGMTVWTALLVWGQAGWWKESGLWMERRVEFALFLTNLVSLVVSTLAWGAYRFRVQKQKE